MQYLHERLKHLAGLIKIKNTEIAKRLGVEKTLITLHFNNQRKVTIEHLEVYAEIFKTSARELLEGTDEWEDPEYQEFTNFLQRKEQPEKRASTHSERSNFEYSKSSKKMGESIEEDRESNNFLDKMSYLFAGVAAASAGTLIVNALAKKSEKKKPKS